MATAASVAENLIVTEESDPHIKDQEEIYRRLEELALQTVTEDEVVPKEPVAAEKPPVEKSKSEPVPFDASLGLANTIRSKEQLEAEEQVGFQERPRTEVETFYGPAVNTAANEHAQHLVRLRSAGTKSVSVQAVVKPSEQMMRARLLTDIDYDKQVKRTQKAKNELKKAQTSVEHEKKHLARLEHVLATKQSQYDAEDQKRLDMFTTLTSASSK